MYTSVKSSHLSGGLIHKEYNFLTNDGWVRANVIEADMTNSNLALRPLWSDNGVGTLVTTKTLVSQNNALAGINGDFFAWASDVGAGKGSPIGTVVRDGELKSSDDGIGLAEFYQYADGILGAGYFKSKISVKHTESGTVEEIGGVNKYSDLTSPFVYTPAWGAEVKSVYTGMCKVVVDDGVVVEVTGAVGSLAIPQNGFILVLLPDRFPFVNLINVGDHLELVSELLPDLSMLESAIGGGTFLLYGGEYMPIAHGPSGRHPRTGIGMDSTRTRLYLVTVDGRQNHSLGVTLPDFAEIMSRIGADTAINFDGGGSTSMAARTLDGSYSLMNIPSENRAVANIAAVVSKGKTGYLTDLLLIPDRDKIYLGETVNLEVYGLDSYGNTTAIDKNKLKISGLTPAAVGEQEIKVVYENITATAKILVFEPNWGDDPQNVPAPASDAAFSFNIFGELPAASTMADKLLKNKLISALNTGSYNIAASKAVPNGVANVKMVASYNYMQVEGDNAFIALDNSKGGLRAVNPAQWSWFTQMSSVVQQKNVFIILGKDLASGGFTDSRELEAFYDIITQNLVARGKNVYVFTSASASNLTRREGVRYITAASAPVGSDKYTVMSAAGALKYVQVTVRQNGDVTWEQKGVL
jgi:exopolysaccharide biosynthesis protein